MSMLPEPAFRSGMDMSMWTRARVWMSTLVRRDRFEGELADELAFHLQSHVDNLQRRGLPPTEARRRARLEFGNPETIKEDVARRAAGRRIRATAPGRRLRSSAHPSRAGRLARDRAHSGGRPRHHDRHLERGGQIAAPTTPVRGRRPSRLAPRRRYQARPRKDADLLPGLPRLAGSAAGASTTWPHGGTRSGFVRTARTPNRCGPPPPPTISTRSSARPRSSAACRGRKPTWSSATRSGTGDSTPTRTSSAPASASTSGASPSQACSPSASHSPRFPPAIARRYGSRSIGPTALRRSGGPRRARPVGGRAAGLEHEHRRGPTRAERHRARAGAGESGRESRGRRQHGPAQRPLGRQARKSTAGNAAGSGTGAVRGLQQRRRPARRSRHAATPRVRGARGARGRQGPARPPTRRPRSGSCSSRGPPRGSCWRRRPCRCWYDSSHGTAPT